MDIIIKKKSDIKNTIEFYSFIKDVMPEDESIFENYYLQSDLSFSDFVEFLYEKDYINSVMKRKFYEALKHYNHLEDVPDEIYFKCLTGLDVEALSATNWRDYESFKIADYFLYCYCDFLMQPKNKTYLYAFLEDVWAEIDYQEVKVRLLEVPKENPFVIHFKKTELDEVISSLEDAIELTDDDLFKNLLANALNILA